MVVAAKWYCSFLLRTYWENPIITSFIWLCWDSFSRECFLYCDTWCCCWLSWVFPLLTASLPYGKIYRKSHSYCSARYSHISCNASLESSWVCQKVDHRPTFMGFSPQLSETSRKFPLLTDNYFANTVSLATFVNIDIEYWGWHEFFDASDLNSFLCT